MIVATIQGTFRPRARAQEAGFPPQYIYYMSQDTLRDSHVYQGYYDIMLEQEFNQPRDVSVSEHAALTKYEMFADDTPNVDDRWCERNPLFEFEIDLLNPLFSNSVQIVRIRMVFEQQRTRYHNKQSYEPYIFYDRDATTQIVELAETRWSVVTRPDQSDTVIYGLAILKIGQLLDTASMYVCLRVREPTSSIPRNAAPTTLALYDQTVDCEISFLNQTFKGQSDASVRTDSPFELLEIV